MFDRVLNTYLNKDNNVVYFKCASLLKIFFSGSNVCLMLLNGRFIQFSVWKRPENLGHAPKFTQASQIKFFVSIFAQIKDNFT